MKNKNTLLATTAVILLISAFSVYFARKINVNKEVKLDHSVRTLNFTNYKNIDTITNVCAQLLKITNVPIVLVPITDIEEQLIYYGYVQKRGRYYLIKIHPNVTEDLIREILAHELFHAKQYESGKLERLYYGVRYLDKVYTWRTPYYDKPYERLAFEAEFDLKIKLKQLIPLEQ